MNKNNDNQFVVLGHRGSSLMAPENTRPAFEFAQNHGAGILELDVRLSRDNHLIVIHDESVDRTTDAVGRVADLGLAQLKQMDAGYRFNKDGQYSYRGVGVELCTLQELLTGFEGIGFNVDIKDNSPRAVDEFARVIERAEARDRTVLASFHHSVLEYCRATYPWIKTSASRVDVRRFYWSYLRGCHCDENFATTLYQLPTRFYLLSFANKKFIDAIHAAGAQVHFWTINDQSLMQKLIALGADGIVTDRADLADASLRGE